MLWLGKKPAEAAPAARDPIDPAPLPLELDRAICARKLAALQEELAQAADAGTGDDAGEAGLAPFLEALTRKHELFARLLAPEALGALDREGFDALLETVFTARRRLPRALQGLDLDRIGAAMRELLYGEAPLAGRLEGFAGALGVEGAKEARAAWDFGAELLHYREPVQYPLMSRWVWDVNTMSGALRELVRGNDTMRNIPLDGRPETFEGARRDIAGFLSEEGYYRDVPFLVDLLLAKAYSDYVQDMAKGVGVFAAELGARNDPLEFVAKMLGIDPHRRRGRSRVARHTVH